METPPWSRDDILARLEQEFIALLDGGDDSSYAKGRRAELAYCIVMNEQDGHDRITIPNILIDEAFRVTMRKLGVPLRFINTDLIGTDTITFTFDGTSVSIYRRTQVKNTVMPVDVPTFGGTLASLRSLQPYLDEDKIAGAFGVHFDYVSTGGFTTRAAKHAQMLTTCLLPPTTTLTLLTMPSLVTDAKSIINTVTPTLNITPTAAIRGWIPKFITHASAWLSTDATLGGDIRHLSDVYTSDGCYLLDAHMGSGKTRSIIELLYSMPSDQRVLLVVSSQASVEHFKQESAHYVGWWDEHVGVITTRSSSSSKRVTIMSIHVASPTNIPEDLHLTIVDEAHILHSTGYTLAEDRQNTGSDFRGAVLAAIKRSNKILLCTGSPVHGDECSPSRQFSVSGAECIREGYIVPIRVDLACVPADGTARLHVAADHIKTYIGGAVRNILVRVNSVERADLLVEKLGGVTVLRAYGEYDEHADALHTGMLEDGAVIVAVGRLIDSANIMNLEAVWNIDGSNYIKTVQSYARSYRRAVGKISALAIVSMFDDNRARAMESVAMIAHGLGHDVSELSPGSALWPNVIPMPRVAGSGSSSSTGSNSSGSSGGDVGDVGGSWLLERDIVDMTKLAERVKAKASVEYGVKRATDGVEDRRLAKLAVKLAWKEEQERGWHRVVDWFNEHDGKLPREVKVKGLEYILALILKTARKYMGRPHTYLSGLTGEDEFRITYNAYINRKNRAEEERERGWHRVVDWYHEHDGKLPRLVKKRGLEYTLALVLTVARKNRGLSHKYFIGLSGEAEFKITYNDYINVKRASETDPTVETPVLKLIIEYCILHKKHPPYAHVATSADGTTYNIGRAWCGAIQHQRSVEKVRYIYLHENCEVFRDCYNSGTQKHRSKQTLTALLAYIAKTGQLPTSKFKSDIDGNVGGDLKIGTLTAVTLRSKRGRWYEHVHQELLKISPVFVARYNKLQQQRPKRAANPPKKKQRIE